MRDRPRTLRWRVTVATTLLGALLSLLFAAATDYLTEDYEAILVTEMLGSEAQDYTLALAADPRAALPRSHRLSGYLQRGDGTGAVPTELRRLAPGVHVDEAGLPDGMSVGVFDIAQGRLYFVMDLGDIEVLEAHLAKFLIAIVVLGTGLAAWLGWILAGASLRPVRELAAAVDALPTVPRASDLSALTGDDELGHVAAAIDRYQDRLVEADAEERRFFADASHELRTPIAVVRGVAEVILDDPDVRDEQRRWLARLDRGMAQVTLLLDVLLGLARGREWQLEAVHATELVAESLAALELRDALVVDNAIDGDALWTVSRPEARLVLQAVARRLVGASAGGRLRASGSARVLEFAFVAAGSTPASALGNLRGDVGAGMTLVTRLAGLLGWSIEYGDEGGDARTARIDIRPG